eukprot:scaffold250603_cov35-Tisochrysis_lutea.AAC.2
MIQFHSSGAVPIPTEDEPAMLNSDATVAACAGNRKWEGKVWLLVVGVASCAIVDRREGQRRGIPREMATTTRCVSQRAWPMGRHRPRRSPLSAVGRLPQEKGRALLRGMLAPVPKDGMA